MPSIAFVSQELNEEISKINKTEDKTKSIFPEHEFLLMAVKLGLSIRDLKVLTYIDVMKMAFCQISDRKPEESGVRKATQKDIDNLLR